MIGRYEAVRGVFRRVSRVPHTPVDLSLPGAHLAWSSFMIKSFIMYSDLW